MSMLLNIVSNATKFTHEGSIVCELDLNPAPNEETEVAIKIKDSGISISKDPTDKLFQAFTLISLLDKHVEERGEFAALWPANRDLSPRIRVFVDFLVKHLRIS